MDRFTVADQALFEIDADIARYGWHATAVLGNPGPPWLYTVGLLEQLGHPELIVFGLTGPQAYGGVGLLIKEIEAGPTPSVGRNHPFDLDGVRACLVPVLDEYWRYPCDYLIGCGHYYGAKGLDLELRALQLVWSDSNGSFPWDDAIDPGCIERQPLLDRTGAFIPVDCDCCWCEGES